MENMTDSKVVNRILRHYNAEDVVFTELRTATDMNGDRLYVNEGAAERWADVRAINYVSFAIWSPKSAFDALRDEAPNNAEDLLDGFDALVNATATQIKKDAYDVARTRGFARQVSELAAQLVGDTRQDNYTYRVYRLLAQSEPKLNIGTNPLGKTKEFYAWREPIMIVDEESEDEPEADTSSAAAAEW